MSWSKVSILSLQKYGDKLVKEIGLIVIFDQLLTNLEKSRFEEAITHDVMNQIDKISYLLKRLQNPEYLLRRSLEAYRVMTSPLRLLPEFLVIGVQKGGTTSLYKYLEQHPCVASAFAKEVHFFDNHTRDYRYGKGIAWYRSHFVYSVFKLYNALIHQQTLITGEGSPDYIFDLHAPKRIAATLPHIKLIILLRNPVDRAYSHYLHNVRAAWDPGREPLSFEEAIAAEAGRLQGEREKLLQDETYFSYSYMHYSYLHRGLYADQLETWFNLYSKEQLLILQSESFFADPKNIFNQVLDFLELPHLELAEYKPYNARTEQADAIAPDTRAKLIKYFKPHNQRLYQLLGFDLGWDE
jgi:Sulfotransferase domain